MISPLMTSVALGSGLIFMFFLRFVMVAVRRYSRRIIEIEKDFAHYMYQLMTGIKMIKTGISRVFVQRQSDKFATDFNLNDEDINRLAALSKSRNIWNDSMFAQDFELIKTLMKATIANIIWGSEAMKALLIQFDKPVIKAIEYLPEAKQMISEK